MRISDWSSDVCSSDLRLLAPPPCGAIPRRSYAVCETHHAAMLCMLGPCWTSSARMALPAGFHRSYRRNHPPRNGVPGRSEEHTSELQSLMRISYAVFCLKKKKKRHQNKIHNHTT